MLTALASLATTIGYRLVVTDRIMAAQAAQRRAHEAEMASAAAIQRAMLPSAGQSDFAEGRLDIFAHMIPAREVGGDLYDIVKLDGNRVMISIGDVCGKGVPASLFMAITQTVMRLVVRFGQDLQTEINSANKLMVANNREDMFTTLFCGVIDVPSGTMTYCNCGHNPPLVLRQGASTFEPLRNLRAAARDPRRHQLRAALDRAGAGRHAAALHRRRDRSRRHPASRSIRHRSVSSRRFSKCADSPRAVWWSTSSSA